jgi:nitrogen regulatory protein PII
MVEDIVNTFVEAAHTGSRLDGMVFVLPVERVLRIQTWQTDEAVF